MDDPKFLVLYGGLALLVLASIRKASQNPKVNNCPYWNGFKFLANAPDLIQAGYNQYPEGVFRVARRFYWLVVVSNPQLVKEVGAAPENILSFHEGVQSTLPVRHVVGRAIAENHYHQHTIRTGLTRNLHACFPRVKEEIACAFDDVLQLHGSEWKSIPVLPMIMAVVSRVSNRLFVDLPLCRNQTYLENNVQFAIEVIQSGQRIHLFPKLLHPQVPFIYSRTPLESSSIYVAGRLVAPFISRKNKSFGVALETLGPVVAERLSKENELGPNWPGKPNDLISWLLEDAEGEERKMPALVMRILFANFAAIHTSSMTFTHAIFDLTTYPEHLLPMREEAERIIKAEGWTKAALNSMVKIDSFLRESQRLNGIGAVSNQPCLIIVSTFRKVVSKGGFRFSNGTVLPEGSLVCAAAGPIQRNTSIYENAPEFDGFRFARQRAEHAATHDPSQEVFKSQMISASENHLPFGTGKHACPGRFFAATELKAMLAHVVINYDLKAEVEGVRPRDSVFGVSITPNSTAKVQFQKRTDF
ncbi:cytochrome P450 [Mycena olivaceomarginata]|nr:cytochrome P450 [Mycena olivaceomarginata]